MAAKPEDERGAAAEMKKNADILVNTLDSFGVKTHILDICRGPSVTRYELQPQAGIKVSRITSLSDDIALNLATRRCAYRSPHSRQTRRRYRGAQQDPVYRQHPRGV